MNTRQRKLMRLLSSEAKPVSYYARNLNISERTIHNDLNFIEPFLREIGIKLVRKPGVGIYTVSSEEIVRELSNVELSLSLLERQVSIFEDLLFNDMKLSLEKLSEEYFVSVSSIRNDLAQIESKFLNEDTLKLVKDNEGTYLVGNEEAIIKTHIKFCQFIYLNSEQTSNNRGFYKTFRYLYSYEIVDTCLEVIEDVEHKNITFMGDYYRTSLLIVLIVLTDRAKNLKKEGISLSNDAYGY